jgi:arylsulfatase A
MARSRLAAWILLICCTGLAGQDSRGQEAERRPNIVLMMADDFGYECVAANGGMSYATPHLDQLARQGIRFRHCYSQPLCTPSRVQLMTGVYNIRNYTTFGTLPESATTFANLLRNAGYRTCVVGKWQLRGDPRKSGFDEHCLWQLNRVPERYPNPGLEINGQRVDYQNGEYGPDVVSDYACDFIRRNRQRPFLVYYPMILTHCPFCPTPDSPDWDPASPGSDTYKGNPRYFADMVAYLDKTAGKLVRALDENGVRAQTLVLFTGDNGTDKPVVSRLGQREVAGGKGQMTDAGTRVPLIASWPGQTPAGQVSDDLVDFSDFLPTLCEITGTPVPDSLPVDGVSLAPQLTGRPGTPREWAYCWFSRNGGPRGQQWARNQRYKLYADGRFLDVSADVLEERPLPGESLTAEQRTTRARLQQVLDRFRDARPEAVARAGKR